MKNCQRFKQLTDRLLQHPVHAMLLAFVSTLIGIYAAKMMTGLPVLVGFVGLSIGLLLTLFGILAAGLLTLVNGPVQGALVTLAATLPYAITIYFPGVTTGADVSAMGLWFWMGLGVAVASNVLTWVFAMMLQRQTGWSNTLQIGALMGVLLISVLHLVYPDIATWWVSQLDSLQNYYDQAAAVAGNKVVMPPMPEETQAQATKIVTQFINGMIMMLVLVNALFQVGLSRWWQSAMFSPGSLGRELRGIRLSKLAGVLFIASMLFSYLGNSVILDVMPIVYVLFSVAGLSLIHYLFKRSASRHAWFGLTVLYMVLIFTMPFSLIMVSMLALFDIWLNIRTRITKLN